MFGRNKNKLTQDDYVLIILALDTAIYSINNSIDKIMGMEQTEDMKEKIEELRNMEESFRDVLEKVNEIR